MKMLLFSAAICVVCAFPIPWRVEQTGFWPAEEIVDRGNVDVGYHIHEGKHDLTAYDWRKFMDFTDAHG